MEERYNFREIEAKWQERWAAERTFRAPDRSDKPKFYGLEFFPYPSGAGLHVGHLKNYVPTDTFCRFKSMSGFNVLHPMGWDAFGQPAENEAILRRRNPREMVPEYAASYKRTLQLIGASYDWDREINSSLPDYYRWTQWIFLLLYRRGLAYRATTPINWCPDCKTGLANEEVKEGRCWRCSAPIEKRPMPQWYLKITDYADRLLADLDTIDWPDGIKQMQREWIGRSEGAEVAFPVSPSTRIAGGIAQGASILFLTTRLLQEGVAVIALDGELDVYTSPLLRQEMADLLNRGLVNLVVDLNNVAYLDSNGLGALIGGLRRTRERGGDLRLVCDNRRILRAFEITGLTRSFDIDPTMKGGVGVGASIPVFTTRPDTLFGATFMVLAPEHPLVEKLTTPDRRAEVEAYVRRAEQATEIERASTERAKSGVFTGAYAINPINNEPIPIWVADYVLKGYGTGAIMAVPAHDQRDFEFARRYGLPIRLVYQIPGGPTTPDEMTEALPEAGTMINSGPFDGLPNDRETIAKFIAWLEQTGKGAGRVQYRLRDWLISRQRYWGAPIPIVHCAACGAVSVPEEELPVLLPEIENYQPSGTGESPLATVPEFLHTTCPRCGGPARRETDTMGGAACSSWYFLRFADPHNDHEFAARDKVDYWLPVDLYVGGAEHAVMHLLYARFWTKVLHDAGSIGFQEPFRTLRNQGQLLAWTPGRRPQTGEEGSEDEERIVDWILLKSEERETYPADQIVWRWARMSKSRYNVITPDEIAERYGADSLRVYEMFVVPFEENVQWTEEGINGAFRFLSRVWRWTTSALPEYDPAWREHLPGIAMGPGERKIRRKLHQTIRKVGEDIEGFHFNTAIAALMELVNELYAYRTVSDGAASSADSAVVSEALETLVLLLAPFAPHLAEELWARLGKTGSTYHAAWPTFDAAVAAADEITLVVQVNGKLRDRLTLPADTPAEALQQHALASAKVQAALDGKQVRKVVVVPGKLVNIVVG
jgi:leucyl-tRNA synthetase